MGEEAFEGPRHLGEGVAFGRRDGAVVPLDAGLERRLTEVGAADEGRTGAVLAVEDVGLSPLTELGRGQVRQGRSDLPRHSQRLGFAGAMGIVRFGGESTRMILLAWLAMRKGLYSTCRSDYVLNGAVTTGAPSGASFVFPL